MQLVVALAAEGAAGVQALRLLAKRGHRPAAVFTTDDSVQAGATVAAAARHLEIPVRPAEEVCDPVLGGWLRSAGADLLLNVHSLHIVHPDVLEAPALGAFNLHPGPLPERAGLNSPSWALYEGDDRHGVTLHRMTAGIDEGAVAFADSFPVGPDDVGLDVLTQCVRRGLPLVERLLDLAERGAPIPDRAQDRSRRRMFGAGPPEGGRLDWGSPARQVVDFVRACDYRPFRSPWAFPRCAVGGRELAIAGAKTTPGTADAEPGTVSAAPDGGVIVAASDGLVRVNRVEIEGRTTDAAELLRPGERLEPAVDADVAPRSSRAR